MRVRCDGRFLYGWRRCNRCLDRVLVDTTKDRLTQAAAPRTPHKRNHQRRIEKSKLPSFRRTMSHPWWTCTESQNLGSKSDHGIRCCHDVMSIIYNDSRKLKCRLNDNAFLFWSIWKSWASPVDDKMLFPRTWISLSLTCNARAKRVQLNSSFQQMWTKLLWWNNNNELMLHVKEQSVHWQLEWH